VSILRRDRRRAAESAPSRSNPVLREEVPRAGSPIPPRTRAGATWVIACVAVLVLIALIIFVAQNSGSVEVSFLSLHGRFSLAVALLAAVAAGSALTLALGTTRILQLRHFVRRRQHGELTAHPLAERPQTVESPPSSPASHDTGREATAPTDRDPDPGG